MGKDNRSFKVSGDKLKVVEELRVSSLVDGEVKPVGNGAHILVGKDLIGKKVKVLVLK